MPTRRRLIALTATTASAGVYGCVSPPESSDDEDEEDGEDTNETEETDGTGDEEDDGDEEEEEVEAEAEFGFVELSAPSEVVLNEEFQVEFTVENTGDADGTFETEVRHQYAWSNYTFEDVTLEIAAGESATYTSDAFSMPYLRWFEFEAPDFDESVRTEATRPRLSFEETFTTPGDVEIEVWNPDTTGRYKYTPDGVGDTAYMSPEDDDSKWGRAKVRCTNRSERTRDLPALDEFDMVVPEGDVSSAVDDEKMDDAYRPTRVAEGGSREGWIVFEIPDDIGRNDVSVLWEREFEEGDSAARWDR